MKLRNKKTGVIVDLSEGIIKDCENGSKIEIRPSVEDWVGVKYNSLAELNEEWEDMPEEEWRDVLGFEELYQVSNLGKVRTIKKGEAKMSQQENRNGYLTVHLRNKGVERTAMVHRLVAEAFIPNPDELRDVNHKNGNKADNRVENLEWVSHSDNMTHSFRELGKNVRHIVQIGLDGTFIERWNSITEAAEATGICRTDIGACCRGERTMAGAFEWKYEEDYEEPEKFYIVEQRGIVDSRFRTGDGYEEMFKEIGNYFKTREEAEKALEKLKAWKRLEDKQFKFYGWNKGSLLKSKPNTIEFACDDTRIWSWEDIQDDLNLLFGGGE